MVVLAGLLVLGGSAAAAVAAWPRVRLAVGETGLATVGLPGFAGQVAVRAVSSDGHRVPAHIEHGVVVPDAKLAPGDRVTIAVTVGRPGWIGWLVGDREQRTFAVVTPAAHVVSRLLEPRAGATVAVRFDEPVSVVSLGGTTIRLPRPERVVPLGVVARGAHASGRIRVAAAAHTWEQLSAPVRVTWFVPQAEPQVLAAPAAGSTLAPGSTLSLTFSRPVRALFGSRLPRIAPATPGGWSVHDGHTLVFRPSGLGFGLGATVQVTLPTRALVADGAAAKPTRTLAWSVQPGSLLRLQQLLATLGYLPLRWRPAGAPATTLRSLLASATTPAPGRFTWRWKNTPASLRALWSPGQLTQVTRGAIMAFEHANGLVPDALPGPAVWRALLQAVVAGRRHTGGYTYVFVHETVPQSLNLWHDGRVILRSPGNTGIAAAPTQPGTWPVFEHIPSGTMSGTNPDGSHYNDPGVQYISYFHGGDAIHAFNRPSYGTPQSLGCVELPLAAAAKVWPYTPIGTLVTVER